MDVTRRVESLDRSLRAPARRRTGTRLLGGLTAFALIPGLATVAAVAGPVATARADEPADAASVDLAVTATSTDTTVDAGDSFAYVVTVEDLSDDDSHDTRVAVSVPSGWTYRSDDSGETATTYTVAPHADPDTGGATGAGLWDVGDLPAHTTKTLVLYLDPVVAGSRVFGAAASSTAADQTDPRSTNDHQSMAVRVLPTANMTVTGTVNNSTPLIGQTVKFTVRAINQGPDAATGVTVSAPLPAGLTYVSQHLTLGTYDPVSGLWAIGSIQSGSARTLFISATVDSDDPATLAASVTSNAHEPDSSDNASSVTVAPSSSAAGATAGPTPQPTPNPTPQPAPQPTPKPQPTPQPAPQPTPKPQPTPQPAPQPAPRPQPTPKPQPAPRPAPRTWADLRVHAAVSSARPVVGHRVTLTARITNGGSGVATGAVTTVQLPAALRGLSWHVSQGRVHGGVWSVGRLAPGHTAVITITALVRSTHPGVVVVRAGMVQHDPTPNNDTARLHVVAHRLRR